MPWLAHLLPVIALAWLAIEHRHLMRGLRRTPLPSPSPPRPLPTLTVVRPIRGLDVGADENTRALLESDYPGRFEVLFILDDARDPALTTVSAAIARHRATHPDARVRVLFCGRPPAGRTGKLHAMALGVREAAGDLIAFSDSDTRLDRDLLRVLVERLLTTPGAADVFAPAVATFDARRRTTGDVGYALMLNAWYGATAVAAAGPHHELPFIMGQLMVWRREALAAIGGVESADGQLVDDMYLGRRVVEAGLHNVMSEHPLEIEIGGMGGREFLRLMRRWVLFARSGLPTAFKLPSYLRGVAVWLGALGLVLGLGGGWPVAALCGAAALVAVCASDRALQRAMGGDVLPLQHAWVSLLIPLLAPAVLASMAIDHHVDWRGRDYRLDDKARLSGPRATPP